MSDDEKVELEQIALCRELIRIWIGLFKAVGLYDVEHNAVRSLCERIISMNTEIAGPDADLDFTVRNESIFIDAVRIREAAVGGASYRQLVNLVRAGGIGSFRIAPEAGAEEIETFARLLLATSERKFEAEEMIREMGVRGVTEIDIVPATHEEDLPKERNRKELEKRMYLRSIGVLKGVFHDLRTKDRINARRVKRIVHQMIESFEEESTYLLHLTSVKNYDEYTFNHSVNVGVLAIALGRAIGLSRRQLYAVGQAGMLHDIGKLCVPKEVLNKPGRLTPEELKAIRFHPVEGFVSLATKQGVSDDSIAVALGAYEHHLNVDGSGYPSTGSERPIGFLSRILAIVDRYDAMTSKRVYRNSAIPPPKALAILLSSQRGFVDQTVLRYFLNMMGYYPLGTTVRLCDSSVAIVVGGASDQQLRHLPSVKVVLDADGRPAEGETFDLAANAKDSDALFIIETLNPADYGIEVMDYIL